MIFTDILGGFETLLNDQYAIWFVVLASFVGIVFGALPGPVSYTHLRAHETDS